MPPPPWLTPKLVVKPDVLKAPADRIFQEDQARPIVYHLRFATCWQPRVKGLRMMVNSVFNDFPYQPPALFLVGLPLEGAGFEPSVPLEVLTVGIVPCRLHGPFHASLPKTKFAADSALEEDGFELSVPLASELVDPRRRSSLTCVA
jgi:hypothetical protein